jgi:type II secretory pathway pseudopilin PulG
MFSLIITIISIALVAALALATLYYGGDSFTKGSAEAEVARMMAEGEQVASAALLFYVENGYKAASVQDLVPKYLKTAPAGWDSTENLAWATEVPSNLCEVYNRKLGLTTTPSCADPAYAGIEVCCTE